MPAEIKQKKAFAALSSAIDYNPNSPWALLERGKLFLEQEKYSKAQDDFTAALKLHNDIDEAYVGKGICFLNMGYNLEDTEETFRQALIHNPENMQAAFFFMLNIMRRPSLPTRQHYIQEFLIAFPERDRDKLERVIQFLVKKKRIEVTLEEEESEKESDKSLDSLVQTFLQSTDLSESENIWDHLSQDPNLSENTDLNEQTWEFFNQKLRNGSQKAIKLLSLLAKTQRISNLSKPTQAALINSKQKYSSHPYDVMNALNQLAEANLLTPIDLTDNNPILKVLESSPRIQRDKVLDTIYKLAQSHSIRSIDSTVINKLCRYLRNTHFKVKLMAFKVMDHLIEQKIVQNLDEDFVSHLIKTATEDHAQLSYLAMRILIQIDHLQPLNELRIELAKYHGDSAGMRIDSLKAVIRLGNNPTLDIFNHTDKKYFVQALKDDNKFIRLESLKALSKLPTKSLNSYFWVSLLEEFLVSERDVLIWAEAVRILGRLKSSKTETFLIQLLSDTETGFKSTSKSWVTSTFPKKKHNGVEHDWWMPHKIISQVLAEFGTPTAKKALIHALKHPEKEVRDEAERVLINL